MRPRVVHGTFHDHGSDTRADLNQWDGEKGFSDSTQDHTNPRTIHAPAPPSLVRHTNSHLLDTALLESVLRFGQYAVLARMRVGTDHQVRVRRWSTMPARRRVCEK
jgi:hypothetical protein